MTHSLRYPGEVTNRERQNQESFKTRSPQRAIYFTANALQRQHVIGRLPRNSIIIQPAIVHIIEIFGVQSSNIWVKIGTQRNIESIGKVIAYNTGVFNLTNTGFTNLPTDYGVVIKEEKSIVLSLVHENPNNGVFPKLGSLLGVLFYVDLTQAEGYL